MPLKAPRSKTTIARQSSAARLSERVAELERRLAELTGEVYLADNNRLNLSQKFAEHVFGEEAVAEAIAMVPGLDEDTFETVRGSLHPYEALIEHFRNQPHRLN